MYIKTINNRNYIVVDAIKFIQNNITYYMFALDVYNLGKVCAFEPASYKKVDQKFTEISLTDEKINIEELLKDNSNENFNRHLDEEKVKRIKKYVTEKDDFVFPNSVILSAHDKNSLFQMEEKVPFDQIIDEETLETFNSLNGVYFDEYTNKLYIPDIKKSILIVDGQHRVAGLSLLDQEIQKKLSLPINLVVGQINSVLSSMFYTINSIQKPVNPSVLEYMTNLFLEDLSESKLFQEYIRLLNDNSKSPLYGEIKMFGVGQGLISFSPLHKSLMNLTEEVTSRSKNIPIFRALFKDEENRYIILNLIIFYFKSIKKLFYTTEWPKDNPFIKTTGLMILLYVFPRILLKILDTKYDLTSYKKLELITEDDLFESIKKLLLIDIEPFKKGSSMGMAKVLRDKVLLTLNIENYDEKFADKISWIKKFREKK